MVRARATGVLALGALALHELSYALTGGGPSGAHGSHAYLADAVPVVVMLATALLAVTLLAPLGGDSFARGSRGVVSRTLLYAGLLLGAFYAQELTEALLDPAPGDALAPIAGPGALVAVPLALSLGIVAALVTRGLEDFEERLAAAQLAALPRLRRRRSNAARPRPALLRRLPAAGASLAFGFARRPPPSALPA
jgi:hypothetical protein